jgi:hypothetical protein
MADGIQISLSHTALSLFAGSHAATQRRQDTADCVGQHLQARQNSWNFFGSVAGHRILPGVNASVFIQSAKYSGEKKPFTRPPAFGRPASLEMPSFDLLLRLKYICLLIMPCPTMRSPNLQAVDLQ